MYIFPSSLLLQHTATNADMLLIRLPLEVVDTVADPVKNGNVPPFVHSFFNQFKKI